MDETTKSIIDKITVEFSTPTRIPSGHSCRKFFDCIQLTSNDLARLAAEAVGDLDDDAFDVAVGLAYSGIFFAAAVAGGRQIAILQKDNVICGPDLKGKKVLIVDDVVHKGTHLAEASKLIEAEGGIVVGYACIIDRSEGAVGGADRPLWSAYQTSME